jgi:hypothetical protein
MSALPVMRSSRFGQEAAYRGVLRGRVRREVVNRRSDATRQQKIEMMWVLNVVHGVK